MISHLAAMAVGLVLGIGMAQLVLWRDGTIAELRAMRRARQRADRRHEEAVRGMIEVSTGPVAVKDGLSTLTVDGEPVWCCEEAALAYPAPCPEHAPLRDVAAHMAESHPRALGMWPKP